MVLDTFQQLETEILVLINSSKLKTLSLSATKERYEQQFGKRLVESDYGSFKKLSELVQALDSIHVVIRNGHPFLAKRSNYSSHQGGAQNPPRQSSSSVVRRHKLPTFTRKTVFLVETLKLLDDYSSFLSPPVAAISCEGTPDALYLIQLGTPDGNIFVFDCVKLGVDIICDRLRPLLTNISCLKLFHDLHNDAVALAAHGGIHKLQGCVDSQLVAEYLTGELQMSFNKMLKEVEGQQHLLKTTMKSRVKGNSGMFAQRPLPADALQYAADNVKLLVAVVDQLRLKADNQWNAIQRASDARASWASEHSGERQVCFDVSNSYSMASFELLNELRPDDVMLPTALIVSNETASLVTMLPDDVQESLIGLDYELSEVILDKGRRPHAWVSGKRIIIGQENRQVQEEELESIAAQLGGFGSDNRAGLEKQLHRISAIRNRASDIIGLTMRVGRHVTGNTAMIADLLFGDTTKSILFLGEPGSGKTTVVREATRLLAERVNTCIVDTSNEIAGDGDIPHPCVGFARRMMVPSLDKQSAVMIECVQNHTPEVMVIDEIGRPTEVEAARTCKNRGVRLIASAHGDLRKLVKNPKLRSLVGGIESVTLGDAQAKEEAKKRPGGGEVQKVVPQRSGPPVFEILVELRRGQHNQWRIVADSGDAVDRILQGNLYHAQRRTREPHSGAVSVHLEEV